MSLPVGHALDERLRLACQFQDRVGDLAILALVAAADVVRLAVHAMLDEEIDGGAVLTNTGRMKVIAESFRGKSRVQQHQIVYQSLQGQMGGVLHALALQTGTP